MGAQRRTCQAVVAAVVLCAGARALASVQVEPIARLSLEGGYDSNFLYDGRGGDVMRRDHRSTLTAEVGVIYAADPIGLARLGIFGRSDAGLIVQGAARAAWRLDHDWRIAGTFAERVVRFDAGAQDAYANELQAVARYRWTRRLPMEAEGGPALWIPPGAGAPSVLPQAMVQLLEVGRVVDARVT